VPKWAYEDFAVGDVLDLGSRTVSAGEIVSFAREFDPQPMHLDEAAGAESLLGGLSASGLHTTALCMRMMCDGVLLDSTSQGAPGVDYVSWRKPVLAGDTLFARLVVLSKRESASKPNLGFVGIRFEAKNQRGEKVCVMENTGMFLKREAARP
jgi:acyl dehydratase